MVVYKKFHKIELRNSSGYVTFSLVRSDVATKMDEKVRIKEEKPLRSSPDSSTDPWSCPQCGLGNENEAKLLEHLLIQHQIRVVQPQNPNTTRCPVCRKHVADLSSHFALEHGQECKSEPQMNGNSLTRIIPVVLNGQPGKQN